MQCKNTNMVENHINKSLAKDKKNYLDIDYMKYLLCLFCRNKQR